MRDSRRIPEIVARINGHTINSVVSFESHWSGPRGKSRSRLTISINRGIIFPELLYQSSGSVLIQVISRDYRLAEQETVFDGVVLEVTVDPIRRLLHFHNHDYSIRLSKVSHPESFFNQTSSGIVRMVADRHGLDSNIWETSELIGSVREGDSSQMLLSDHSRRTDEWSLLTYLAELEGYSLFFEGNKLVFGPPGVIG